MQCQVWHFFPLNFGFANLSMKDCLASFCIGVARNERKAGRLEMEAHEQLSYEASGLADVAQLLK